MTLKIHNITLLQAKPGTCNGWSKLNFFSTLRIALYFAITELLLVVSNVLLYYWLNHVHTKLYNDMKAMAGNQTFENLDKWTQQNLGISGSKFKWQFQMGTE